MSNTVRQHIPGFLTGHEPVVAEFDTLEELLAVPFVAHWKSNPGFHRFSMNVEVGLSYLMAEYHNGKEWWVVGYLSGSIPGLPRWEIPGESGEVSRRRSSV